MLGGCKSFEGDDYVVSGRIRRAFGVKGELLVEWNNGASPVKAGGGSVYLERRGAEGLGEFPIISDRRHGRYNVVLLGGIDSREDAEAFKGSRIWVKKDTLQILGDGEYYAYQLIEMRVETTDGEYLGKIKKIFPTGSNDVYVVRDGGRELLIPAISDVVKEVDIEKGVMKIWLIEGLI